MTRKSLWPSQASDRYCTVHYFCKGLTLCPRGATTHFYRDDNDFNVYCFAECEHAERFQARSGGAMHDARLEPRWLQ